MFARWLVTFAIKVLIEYGLPVLEQKFPALIPIVQAILDALNGVSPPQALHKAADHFNDLISK